MASKKDSAPKESAEVAPVEEKFEETDISQINLRDYNKESRISILARSTEAQIRYGILYRNDSKIHISPEKTEKIIHFLNTL